MKVILCTACGAPIVRKQELCVAGKLLQPYHATCLARPTSALGKLHAFTGKFPRGAGFWILLLLGNAMLGLLMAAEGEAAVPVGVFAVVCNAVFLIARLGIYLTYERYLD